MPPMPIIRQSHRLSPTPFHNHSSASMPQPEVPPPLEDDRSADLLEAHSIKWNVARIVRLSSGRFALLTHYHAGALDIIKVGTIEEIVNHIPTTEQCIDDSPRILHKASGLNTKANLDSLLVDISKGFV